MTSITSASNDRVRLVRALQTQAKTRRREAKIVLEGVRLITDALDSGSTPDFVLYTSELTNTGRALLARLKELHVACFEVTDELMSVMADTDTPQGFLAVVPTPQPALTEQPNLLLLLDGVADPGNMGTILRTAAAVGVDLVVLLPGCVDAFSPKVLRSAMGAHFRVAVTSQNWDQFSAQYPDLPLYVADSDGTQPYYAVDWKQPAGLVIGGEARGVNSSAYTAAHSVISIPMNEGAESLNAAIATAVILFECRRQRTLG